MHLDIMRGWLLATMLETGDTNLRRETNKYALAEVSSCDDLDVTGSLSYVVGAPRRAHGLPLMSARIHSHRVLKLFQFK